MVGTNHSSGKMGYSIAEAAALRGAETELISGPVSIPEPMFVNITKIRSAEDMFNAAAEKLGNTDILIMAAAVADYTPTDYSEHKIKKKDGDMFIPLRRTKDILKYAGENKKSTQTICGFSMETQDLIENSRKKLLSKNCDIIAANSILRSG